MQMTLRWYGSKFDTVTLKQIRQIQELMALSLLYMIPFQAKYGAEKEFVL